MKNQNCPRRTFSNRNMIVLTLLIAFMIGTFIAMAAPVNAQAGIEKEFKRRATRDPFVPPVGKKTDEVKKPPVEVVTPVTPVETSKTNGAKPVETGKKGTDEVTIPVRKKVRLVDVSDQMQVTGIMKSSGTRYAIINAGEQGYLVRSGQKLGEWTVASVNERTVELKAKGFRAKLELPSDMEKPEGGELPAPGK